MCVREGEGEEEREKEKSMVCSIDFLLNVKERVTRYLITVELISIWNMLAQDNRIINVFLLLACSVLKTSYL